MSQRRKGRNTPARWPGASPGDTQKEPMRNHLVEGEVRAKTMARLPLESAPTQPLVSVIIDQGTTQKKEIVLPYAFVTKIKPVKQTVTLTRNLGKGAMGLVFQGVTEIEGEDKKMHFAGDVAVKIIFFDEAVLGSDPENKRDMLYKLFISEIILLKKLSQDNIIRIQDFGAIEDLFEYSVPFYSMDLLPGKDLEKLISEQKTLSWERVRPLMIQVCKALEYAHNYKERGVKKPIIHQDIKPSNIFVTTNGEGKEEVKLLDFGIAKIAAPQNKETNQDQGISGTPGYLSPEQASLKEIDHRTDIYSVGSTMYHLVSGRATYEGTIGEILAKTVKEAPEPLIASGVDIPPEAERIIFKCLEKDPAKRYQSAKELMEDIKRCDIRTREGSGTAVVRVNYPDNDDVSAVGPTLPPVDPLEAEPTEIVQMPEQHEQKPKRLGRRLLFGAVAALGIGALSTSYFLLGNNKSGDATNNNSRITRPEHSPKNKIAKKTPLAESALDSRSAPVKQPEEKVCTITLKADFPKDGKAHPKVEFLLEDQPICPKSEKTECEFKLPKSNNSLQVTFRAEGYKDIKESFLPFKDWKIEKTMEPLPVKTQSKRKRHRSKTKKFLFGSGKKPREKKKGFIFRK